MFSKIENLPLSSRQISDLKNGRFDNYLDKSTADYFAEIFLSCGFNTVFVPSYDDPYGRDNMGFLKSKI